MFPGTGHSDQPQQFQSESCCKQRCNSGAVIRRGNLDHVCADNPRSPESLQEHGGLQTRRSTNLRGAGTRRKRWIDPIDIEGHIDRAISSSLERDFGRLR